MFEFLDFGLGFLGVLGLRDISWVGLACVVFYFFRILGFE